MGNTNEAPPGADEDADMAAQKLKDDLAQEFREFREENIRFWTVFNSLILLTSIGLGVGCYFVWGSFVENVSTKKCVDLRDCTFFVMIMHGINAPVAILNLTGLESKVCRVNLVAILAVFELCMLVFMMIAYFDSQAEDCMRLTPLNYFWLMGHILLYMLSMAIIVCYFFRKVCQDPDLEEEQAYHEAEAQKAKDIAEGVPITDVEITEVKV